jgi:hypothetical protein
MLQSKNKEYGGRLSSDSMKFILHSQKKWHQTWPFVGYKFD